MVELPIPRREIRRIYDDLADEVSTREQRIGETLPVDETAHLPTQLRNAAEKWESGRKSLRTVPACNAYARLCDRRVSAEAKRTLTGLDATINVFDDIIDTQTLTTQTKVALTANAAFSAAMMVESRPEGARAEINDVLLDYFAAVFQIPLVERRVLQEMMEAPSPEDQRDAAATFYAYRSRDIDAFAQIPAALMDVDTETEHRVREDLRSYRARRLLFKDISDVERDLTDGDTTPLIHFLRTCETTEGVVTAIEDLYGRFSYSDMGRASYGDLLKELEAPPEDLYSVIREKRGAVIKPVQ